MSVSSIFPKPFPRSHIFRREKQGIHCYRDLCQFLQCYSTKIKSPGGFLMLAQQSSFLVEVGGVTITAIQERRPLVPSATGNIVV
jgi:hypothetical protein